MNAKSNTSGYLGATALIAIMEPATKNQKFSRKKIPLESCPSNKIKVLLDSGLDGDLYFLHKGTDIKKVDVKVLAYFKWELPNKWKG